MIIENQTPRTWHHLPELIFRGDPGLPSSLVKARGARWKYEGPQKVRLGGGNERLGGVEDEGALCFT